MGEKAGGAGSMGDFALGMKTFRRSPVVEISLMPYTYYGVSRLRLADAKQKS